MILFNLIFFILLKFLYFKSYFNYFLVVLYIFIMASRTPRSINGGGPNKTCQFKLVLLGESAVGIYFLNYQRYKI